MNLDSGSRGGSDHPGDGDESSSSQPSASNRRPGQARDPDDPSTPPVDGTPDRGAALMGRWQDGDDGAFEEIVALYSDHVFALLTRFLGRQHPGREDLVQEVFIRVLRARDRYEPSARFSTWLYSITWRICINETERGARRRTLSLDALGGAGGTDAEGSSAALEIGDPDAALPSDSAEQGDLVSAVRRAIAELPENQRIAVVLSRYHQLSYAEIARVVDSSEKAIKSLVHRARETLRQTLQPLMEEELA